MSTSPTIGSNNSFWDRKFNVTERGSTIKREIFAGITSFLCVSYVLAVNPIILGASGMNEGAVFTATAICGIIITLLLGLYTNMPYIGISGMGINAYFAYTVVIQMHHTFMFALTAELIAGLLILLIALTPIKDYIFEAIPHNLKLAVTAGIGLFIALIGLSSVGIVVSNQGTIVGLGSFTDPNVIIAIIGVILITAMTARGIKGTMFIAIIACAILGVFLGVTKLPNSILSLPPSMAPVFMKLDVSELLTSDMFFVVFTFLFVNLFNIVGVLIGLSEQAEVPEADRQRVNGNCMKVAALGTTIAGLFGASPHIVAVESAAGIAEGGRTGISAITSAILFVVSLFFAPLLMVIPAAATAPVLIVVGLFMLICIKAINFEDITEGIPAFLTIIMMPFTYSIGVGIEWGLVSYVVVKLLAGRQKDISAIMYVLALIFIVKEIMPFIM